MKPLCRQCGQPFSPVKPWHVTCFDCVLKQVKANVTLRVTPLEKPARGVTQSGNHALK